MTGWRNEYDPLPRTHRRRQRATDAPRSPRTNPHRQAPSAARSHPQAPQAIQASSKSENLTPAASAAVSGTPVVAAVAVLVTGTNTANSQPSPAREGLSTCNGIPSGVMVNGSRPPSAQEGVSNQIDGRGTNDLIVISMEEV